MTRWLDAIAHEAPPAPEIVLLRWIAKLGRLTRWPHPWRPWVLRRMDELRGVSTELNRLRRFADEVVAEAQAEADRAERAARRQRTLERH
jgi:hypothetical protein